MAALLGLARRAGKLAAGDQMAREAVQRRRAAVVVVATDAGQSTKDRFQRLCGQSKVQCLQYGTKAELGNAVGQTEKAVVAVTDQHFAKGIRAALGNGALASEPNTSGVD